MTVQEMKTLFAYNAWANNRIFESLEQMPEDLYLKDLKASHSGIHGTLTHIVAAEKIWLSRWLGTQEFKLLSVDEVSSFKKLKAIWEDIASRTAKFVGRLDEKKLQSSFEFTSTSGKINVFTYQQALQHLVNHSTYHRGQIAAMVRQVGAQPVETDLIGFYRLTRQTVSKR